MSFRLLRSNSKSAKLAAEVIEDISSPRPTLRGGGGKRDMRQRATHGQLTGREQGPSQSESAERGCHTGRRGRGGASGRRRGGKQIVAPQHQIYQLDVRADHEVEHASSSNERRARSSAETSKGAVKATAASPHKESRGMKAFVQSLKRRGQETLSSQNTDASAYRVRKLKPKLVDIAEDEEEELRDANDNGKAFVNDESDTNHSEDERRDSDDDGYATPDNFCNKRHDHTKMRQMHLVKGFRVDPVEEVQVDEDGPVNDVVSDSDDSDYGMRQKLMPKKRDKIVLTHNLDIDGGGPTRQSEAALRMEGDKSHDSPVPFSDQLKTALDNGRLDFLVWLKTTAEYYGKSEESILVSMGFNDLPEKSLSSIYQAWYSAHHEKPVNISIHDWNCHISKEYEKESTAFSSDNKQRMMEVIEWYDKSRKETMRVMDKEGQANMMMEKFSKDLIEISRKLDLYDIQVFGFMVYTGVDKKVISKNEMWGSTKFEMLRKQNAEMIRQQILDYETMFRNIDMTNRGLQVKIPKKWHEEDEISVDENAAPNRDNYRKYIGRFLRIDLVRIIRYRNDTDTDIAKVRLKWKAWPDQAYHEKVRIVGWPVEVRPVPGSDFDLKALELGQLQVLIDPLLERLRRKKSREITDNFDDYETEPFGDKVFLGIEEWTEEEKSLDLKSQHSIDVVRGVNGEKLRFLHESTAYKGAVSDPKTKSIAEQSKRKKTDKNSLQDGSLSSEHYDDSGITEGGQQTQVLVRCKEDKTRKNQSSSIAKPPSATCTLSPRSPMVSPYPLEQSERSMSASISPSQSRYTLPSLEKTQYKIDGQQEEKSGMQAVKRARRYQSPRSANSSRHFESRKRKQPDDVDNSSLSMTKYAQKQLISGIERSQSVGEVAADTSYLQIGQETKGVQAATEASHYQSSRPTNSSRHSESRKRKQPDDVDYSTLSMTEYGQRKREEQNNVIMRPQFVGENALDRNYFQNGHYHNPYSIPTAGPINPFPAHHSQEMDHHRNANMYGQWHGPVSDLQPSGMFTSPYYTKDGPGAPHNYLRYASSPFGEQVSFGGRPYSSLPLPYSGQRAIDNFGGMYNSHHRPEYR